MLPAPVANKWRGCRHVYQFLPSRSLRWSLPTGHRCGDLGAMTNDVAWTTQFATQDTLERWCWHKNVTKRQTAFRHVTWDVVCPAVTCHDTHEHAQLFSWESRSIRTLPRTPRMKQYWFRLREACIAWSACRPLHTIRPTDWCGQPVQPRVSTTESLARRRCCVL